MTIGECGLRQTVRLLCGCIVAVAARHNDDHLHVLDTAVRIIAPCDPGHRLPSPYIWLWNGTTIDEAFD